MIIVRIVSIVSIVSIVRIVSIVTMYVVAAVDLTRSLQEAECQLAKTAAETLRNRGIWNVFPTTSTYKKCFHAMVKWSNDQTIKWSISVTDS